MKIYDRLYGEMKFPSIITELLDCPGLLRLRDVRMANNQFVAFPAFASTSRYEHSLGVCYLAGLCAKELGLPEKDTTELMMASLYHDVGTPPFAHAMEEVLQAKFGFDHEQNLKNLIMGTTGEFDGDMARIFLDEGLKLKSICQSKKTRHLKLDLHKIAQIAAGDRCELLSPLLNGTGMDLDNIDNVIRASSAMGLIPASELVLATRLAHSFHLGENQILYDGFIDDVRRWQDIRDIQYTAIFDSIDDFAYQTMIKKAIQLLMEDNPHMNKNVWKLTDSEIVHDHLLQNSKSAEIMKRVLLCKPFHNLGVLYIKGDDTIKYINSHLGEIELLVSDFFIEKLGISSGKLQRINTNAVTANFYPDKRKREVVIKALLGNKRNKKIEEVQQGALLGLFTPFDNSNYKNTSTGRKSVSFRNEDLKELIQDLSKNCLPGFNISIYGNGTYESTKSDTAGDQLELF